MEKIDNIDKNLNEEATQSANVDGGRIDIFGSKDNFNYNNWYKELLELKDYEDDEYINLNQEAFSSYCSDKLENMDSIEIDDICIIFLYSISSISIEIDDIEYKKIMHIDNIRGFKDLYIIADLEDYEFENLVAINSDNEIVINTPMMDFNQFAAEMSFDKIDKEYYNNLMEYWNDLNMDEYFDQ